MPCTIGDRCNEGGFYATCWDSLGKKDVSARCVNGHWILSSPPSWGRAGGNTPYRPDRQHLYPTLALDPMPSLYQRLVVGGRATHRRERKRSDAFLMSYALRLLRAWKRLEEADPSKARVNAVRFSRAIDELTRRGYDRHAIFTQLDKANSPTT
jgi:hypothetical protein